MGRNKAGEKKATPNKATAEKPTKAVDKDAAESMQTSSNKNFFWFLVCGLILAALFPYANTTLTTEIKTKKTKTVQERADANREEVKAVPKDSWEVSDEEEEALLNKQRQAAAMWDAAEYDATVTSKFVYVYQPKQTTTDKTESTTAPKDKGRIGKDFTMKLEDYKQETLASENKTFCEKLHGSLGGKRTVGCVIFNADGALVRSYANVQANDMLFIVPRGKVFVWPSFELGRNVTIKGNAGGHEYEVTIELLSVEPRLYRLHNFVRPEEVKHYQDLAKSKNLDRSTGGLQQEGKTGDNQGSIEETRTSHNTWDTDSEVSIGIKKRSFDILRIRPFKRSFTDGLQVVHYDPGQFYNAHTDYFDVGASENWNWDPQTGGINRFATVFLYMTDSEKGGATMFPLGRHTTAEERAAYNRTHLHELRDTLVDGKVIKKNGMEYKLVDECVEKLHVPPRTGDAILFYSQEPNGKLDPSSKHAACPVLDGEKLGANLWIWNGPTWDRSLTEMPEGYELNEDDLEDDEDPRRKTMFENQCGESLDVFWVQPGSGALIHLQTLPAGEKYNSDTYVDHIFVLKLSSEGENGREMYRFQVPKRPIAKPTRNKVTCEGGVEHSEL